MIVQRIKTFAQARGFEVFRYGFRRIEKPVLDAGMHYSNVRPQATYSPWLDDAAFLAVYEQIKNHTLVDQYRCHELWDLVGQVSRVPGNLLEVGVWRGGTGALIASRSQSDGSGKRVFLCDTFSGVIKATGKDSYYRGGEHADTSEGAVESLIAAMGLRNVDVLRGVFPDDFAVKHNQERYCFVHVDVDVYLSAKDVFDFVWPRMLAGGVIVFDDYGFQFCNGITRLIQEYRGDAEKLIVHNLNGHALVIKRD